MNQPTQLPMPEETQQVLSCTRCRQRKVKCNKRYPCSHCSRLNLECHFPARKKTQRRPRQARQHELLDRLTRLEAIVSKVDPSSLQASGLVQPESSGHLQASQGTLVGIEALRASSPPFHDNLAPASSRRDEASPASRYLSSDFWFNLCNEVEGLKNALEQPSDDDDQDDDEDEASPESVETAGATLDGTASHGLLGSPASFVMEKLPHPSPEHILFLRDTYFSNVDFLFKVLHQPTISSAMTEFAHQQDRMALDRPTEALYFAIYFAAVTCLEPSACLSSLGEHKQALAARYRATAEAALVRADYLNNSEMAILQAFAIYLACLRCHHESRASWALQGLIVRLARAAGLHQEGGGNFSPFEAEMRRRLWWQIVVLDVRAVEDRGSEAVITRGSFDVNLPTNVNDADFGPSTIQMPAPRDGSTDTTFSLCVSMASRTFVSLCDPVGRFDPAGRLRSQPTDDAELVGAVRRLEALFIDDCDPSHLPSVLAADVLRLITLKIWLLVHYPIQVRVARGPDTGRSVSREAMLRTAVAVLELTERCDSRPAARRYTWWTGTYIQWHPLAVALAELCARPPQPGDEVAERAWLVIDRVFPTWSERVADTKRGSLWRPVRKLMRRAKEAWAGVLGATGPDSPWGSQRVGAGEGQPSGHPPIDSTDATGFQQPVSPAPCDEASWVPPQPLPTHPLEWFDVDHAVDYGDECMDWSSWNEFVSDANAATAMH